LSRQQAQAPGHELGTMPEHRRDIVPIGIWALLLNELSAWAATVNRFAPYALFGAIMSIAVVMYLLHRRDRRAGKLTDSQDDPLI
jgi:hypothetical protein